MKPSIKPFVYRPIHPEKWLNRTNIICRSKLEWRIFLKLEQNPNVIKLGSEVIVIPYISPIDNKVHKYYTDLFLEIKDKDENIQYYVVEIKPDSQTKFVPSSRKKTNYNRASTFVVNKAKWAAAEQYCKKKGWTFKIITEKDF